MLSQEQHKELLRDVDARYVRQRLSEIRERWASRAWPSIGYFVHSQAYDDIQFLLGLMAVTEERS